MDKLIELGTLSGGLLLLLGALLLVTLAVIIERWHFYRRVLASLGELEHELRSAGAAHLDELARRREGSFAATVIRAALALRGADAGVLDGFLKEVTLRQFPRLDRHIWVLDTAVTLGPLLGLLGTIVGMIKTFNIFGAQGAGGSEQIVAGGIGDALVATGAGLAIAVIGLVFLNYFNKCIRLGVHQMELLKTMVVNRLRADVVLEEAGQPHREDASGQAELTPARSAT